MESTTPTDDLTAADVHTIRTTFPSLRCVMGRWRYYVTYMKFSDVSEWVKPIDEIHEIYDSKQLRDLVQREISDRVDDIVEYLRTNEDRFFNSVVLGLYEGAPQWHPVEIGQSDLSGAPTIDDDSRRSVGILTLNGDEVVFPIDGQHRVEAIRRAVEVDSSLGDEDLSVLLVSHGEGKERKQKTRRLFSNLNKHAKAVSPGEIIALDEDDAFAITTRRLVESFDLLQSGFKDKSGLVYFGKTAPLPKSNKRHLTSIITVYRTAEIIYVPFKASQVVDELGDKNHGAALTRLKVRRPKEDVLDDLYDQQTKYWRRLGAKVAAYKDLFSSEASDELAGKYRLEDGHLLFRPKGQIAFARAVRVLMDRGSTLYQAVDVLARVPMAMSGEPWRNTLWEAGTGRMRKGVSDVFLESLFLYMVGQPPRSKAYSNLEEKYRQVLDDETARLPDPVA